MRPVGLLLTPSDGLSSPPELEREREVHAHDPLASPLRLEIERPRFQEVIERDDSHDPVRWIPIDDRESGEASFRHALHDRAERLIGIGDSWRVVSNGIEVYNRIHCLTLGQLLKREATRPVDVLAGAARFVIRWRPDHWVSKEEGPKV